MIQSDMFFQRLKDIYTELVDNIELTGQVEKSVEMINLIEKKGLINCDEKIRISWMQLLLDIFSIVIICKNKPYTKMLKILPEIENPEYLGPLDTRKSNLTLKNKENYFDFGFANRVRAWYRSAGGEPVIDLKDDPSRSNREDHVCDFHFKINKEDILVECKRINSNTKRNNLKRKIRKRKNKSIEQFKDTENWLNLRSNKRILIMDLSAYGLKTKNKIEGNTDIEVLGWDENSIYSIVQELGNIHEELDNILFCWDQIFIIENKPISIIQKVFPIHALGENNIYKGWTLIDCIFNEGKERFSDINRHEISLHGVPKDFAWISEEYQQVADNGKFWGKGEWSEI